MLDQNRQCRYCSKTLLGRADKKFCDHYCRNAYNNSQNTDKGNYVRRIDSILKRNRRLLQKEADGDQRKKVSREQLSLDGFHFGYFTQQVALKTGDVFFYVYDYGYQYEEDDWVWIVRKI